MLVLPEITSFTYFCLSFESETENMLYFYSFNRQKRGLGWMPFVAGPDGAGVGVSTNVDVAPWYMFNISWLGDRILTKLARIQQLGMINSRIGLGDLDLIFKVNTEKSLLNLCQKILKFTLSSEQVSGFEPNLHDFNN